MCVVYVRRLIWHVLSLPCVAPPAAPLRTLQWDTDPSVLQLQADSELGYLLPSLSLSLSLFLVKLLFLIHLHVSLSLSVSLSHSGQVTLSHPTLMSSLHPCLSSSFSSASKFLSIFIHFIHLLYFSITLSSFYCVLIMSRSAHFLTSCHCCLFLSLSPFSIFHIVSSASFLSLWQRHPHQSLSLSLTHCNSFLLVYTPSLNTHTLLCLLPLTSPLKPRYLIYLLSVLLLSHSLSLYFHLPLSSPICFLMSSLSWPPSDVLMLEVNAGTDGPLLLSC